MALEQLQMAYRVNRQGGNAGAWSLDAHGCAMTFSIMAMRYLESCKLEAQDKKHIENIHAVFKPCNIQDQEEHHARAMKIFESYQVANVSLSEAVIDAIKKDSNWNYNEYALMVLAFTWSTLQNEEEACACLAKVVEMSKARTLDGATPMLWAILADIHNYGAPN